MCDIYMGSMVESRAGVDDGCQSNGNGLGLVTEADCRNPTETRMEEGRNILGSLPGSAPLVAVESLVERVWGYQ